jgi:hypothetical protein
MAAHDRQALRWHGLARRSVPDLDRAIGHIAQVCAAGVGWPDAAYHGCVGRYKSEYAREADDILTQCWHPQCWHPQCWHPQCWHRLPAGR